MKNKSIIKQMSSALCKMLLLSLLIYFPSCGDDGKLIVHEGGDVNVVVPNETLKFFATDVSKTLEVKFDKKEGPLTVSVAQNGSKWCSASLDGKTLNVSVQKNTTNGDRETVVYLTGQGRNISIEVRQEGPTSIKPDIKITPIKGEADTEETEKEDRGIQYAFDGDPLTYFNSKFGAVTFPFNITFFFDETVEYIDYINYSPRSDGGNRWGAFGKFEVLVKERGTADFKSVGTFDALKSTETVFKIDFDKPLMKPEAIKFVVISALEDKVSIGEMEFYQKNKENFDALTIFKDWSCSELKDGVTEAAITEIKDPVYRIIAKGLYDKTYDSEFRIQDYRVYKDPKVHGKEIRAGVYGIRDNATGIYIDNIEEPIYVFVGDTKGQALNLVIQDLNDGKDAWSLARTYNLSKGVNMIQPEKQGLIYISNFTSDSGVELNPETAKEKEVVAKKTVKIHIFGGVVNGYFDTQKHKLEDWNRFVDNAPSPFFDVLSRNVHVIWETKRYQKEMVNVFDVMTNWDNLVDYEQEFNGLKKIHKLNPTRVCFVVDPKAPAAYATSYRTAYNPVNYSELFNNPAKYKTRLWGPAHEVGHVNQVRPGLKWAGTTEVTNNIMCFYVQEKSGVPSKMMEKHPGAKVNPEGLPLHAFARKRIVEAGEPHCLHNDGNDDYMAKVVPFWQLHLYMNRANGDTEFYKDLHNHFRTSIDSSDEGERQLEFVRQVCKFAKVDFTKFFTDWGFLRPVDRTIDDYGSKKLKVTAEQIDALVKEIKKAGYPEPTKDVTLITEDNFNDFKETFLKK